MCDVQHCPVKHQQQVFKDVTYHVSNKWFGNYVSVYSWDYLWLRDGISTYYAYEQGEKVPKLIFNTETCSDSELYLVCYSLATTRMETVGLPRFGCQSTDFIRRSWLFRSAGLRIIKRRSN